MVAHYLAQNDLKFCVVGNHDALLTKSHGDIDIVVCQEQLPDFLQQLTSLPPSFPLSLVQSIQHEHNAYYLVFAVQQEGHLRPPFLILDVCGDYYRHARKILPAKLLLSDCRWQQDKGFRAPAAAHNFIYYLIKRMEKGQILAEQGTFLTSEFHQAPKEAKALLEQYLSPPHQELILNALQSGTWDTVTEQLREIRRRLSGQFKPTLQTLLLDWQRTVKRCLFPTGLWVVFLGPDGSGKSTIIKAIQTELEPVFRRTAYYHLRPKFLWSQNKQPDVENPYEKNRRSSLFSTLKLILFMLDYWLGYLVKIRPQLIASTLVCFDRHFIDIGIDPARYRSSLSTRITQTLNRFLPQPDLYIVLNAPAEQLQSRKQEVSLSESENQRQAYLAWAKTQPDSYVISTAHPTSETTTLVMSAILDKLKQNHSQVIK